MKPVWRNNRQIVLHGLAVLCFLLLFVGGPGAYSSRTFTYAWGLGHLLSFGLWSWLYLQWRSRQALWRQCVEVLLLALLLGAGTELLQACIGREATWQDLGNDLLGCLLVLVFTAQLKTKLRLWQLWLLRIPVLLIVGWVVLPFLKVAVDDLVAKQQFPLLSGFETPLELGRWGGNSSRRLDRQFIYSGAASLRVDLNTDRYSGLTLKHFPGDWSRHRALRFQLYNPQAEEFELHFRIHDQQHRENNNRYTDRFNTSLLLQPGWTELEFPLATVARAPRGRQMDLSKIAGIVLFVGKLDEPRTFYLDDVELVR
jgi:hypothetical protein